MITEEEERLYQFLAKEKYNPEGRFFEVGTWLGRSTTRICQGLSHHAENWRLVCYDRFIWTEDHARKVGNRRDLPELGSLRPGYSFHCTFLKLMGEYAERIRTYQGELEEIGTVMKDELGPQDRISVLFVDASKGWTANARMLKFFCSGFSHGQRATALLFQDFMIFSSYKLIFLLQSLRNIEPRIYVEHGSAVVYEVLGSVELSEALHDQAYRRLQIQQIYEAWDRLVTAIPESHLQSRAMGLALPLILWDRGYKDEAFRECRKIKLSETSKTAIAGSLARARNLNIFKSLNIPPILERLR